MAQKDSRHYTQPHNRDPSTKQKSFYWPLDELDFPMIPRCVRLWTLRIPFSFCSLYLCRGVSTFHRQFHPRALGIPFNSIKLWQKKNPIARGRFKNWTVRTAVWKEFCVNILKRVLVNHSFRALGLWWCDKRKGTGNVCQLKLEC